MTLSEIRSALPNLYDLLFRMAIDNQLSLVSEYAFPPEVPLKELDTHALGLMDLERELLACGDFHESREYFAEHAPLAYAALDPFLEECFQGCYAECWS